ncbi:RapZ C-terminal domain-containing protein [Planobispora rosea]|nr:RNase adapter RapZ [Planobispora rosea]
MSDHTAPADLSSLYPDNRIQMVVSSFGYLHGEPIEADVTLDARRQFRNPHDDPGMRYRTGTDSAVRQHVLNTPGVRAIIDNTVRLALDLFVEVADPRFRMVTIAVGCAGGRHRSVAMAEEIASALRSRGVGVDVEHRDIDKPVIETPASPVPPAEALRDSLAQIINRMDDQLSSGHPDPDLSRTVFRQLSELYASTF